VDHDSFNLVGGSYFGDESSEEKHRQGDQYANWQGSHGRDDLAFAEAFFPEVAVAVYGLGGVSPRQVECLHKEIGRDFRLFQLVLSRRVSVPGLSSRCGLSRGEVDCQESGGEGSGREHVSASDEEVVRRRLNH
jgi:hypothetical protein